MSNDNARERGKQRLGGNTGKNTGNLVPPWRPGQSGNWSGRPQGDAKMRRLMLKTLAMSKQEAIDALCRRWKNPTHVQDMVEFLARLEGELSRDTSQASRGVDVIVLNNQGNHPLDPATFREAMERRMMKDRAAQEDTSAHDLTESHELVSQHLPRTPSAQFGLEDFLDPSARRRQPRAPSYVRRRPAAPAARPT